MRYLTLSSEERERMSQEIFNSKVFWYRAVGKSTLLKVKKFALEAKEDEEEDAVIISWTRHKAPEF